VIIKKLNYYVNSSNSAKSGYLSKISGIRDLTFSSNRIAKLLGLILLLVLLVPSSVSLIAYARNSTSPWIIVPSPNPRFVSVSNDILRGVTAISDSNVWAIGTYSSSGGNNIDHTLVERWNGTSWSVVHTPNVGANGSALEAVSASSSNNVWAVGDKNTSGSASFIRTLIEHYNGKSWSVVPSPNPSTQGDDLTGVVAIGSNDV
jgi:hypothetical protein